MDALPLLPELWVLVATDGGPPVRFALRMVSRPMRQALAGVRLAHVPRASLRAMWMLWLGGQRQLLAKKPHFDGGLVVRLRDRDWMSLAEGAVRYIHTKNIDILVALAQANTHGLADWMPRLAVEHANLNLLIRLMPPGSLLSTHWLDPVLRAGNVAFLSLLASTYTIAWAAINYSYNMAAKQGHVQVWTAVLGQLISSPSICRPSSGSFITVVARPRQTTAGGSKCLGRLSRAAASPVLNGFSRRDITFQQAPCIM
jgi:hypothetical protein